MIIVTGHRGFVGQHLCRALRGSDALWLVDRRNGNNILEGELPPADRVYHLAASTDAQNGDAWEDAQTNILGTLRLLQHYGSKLVFASSSMVNYPVTPYGISKLAGEHYARHYGAAIVRFCNLFGDGGHSVIDRFGADKVLTIRGDGEQLRTYAPVEHAVKALMAARPGTTTILPGQDMTVNEVAARYPLKPARRVEANPLDIVDGRQV